MSSGPMVRNTARKSMRGPSQKRGSENTDRPPDTAVVRPKNNTEQRLSHRDANVMPNPQMQNSFEAAAPMSKLHPAMASMKKTPVKQNREEEAQDDSQDDSLLVPTSGFLQCIGKGTPKSKSAHSLKDIPSQKNKVAHSQRRNSCDPHGKCKPPTATVTTVTKRARLSLDKDEDEVFVDEKGPCNSGSVSDIFQKTKDCEMQIQSRDNEQRRKSDGDLARGSHMQLMPSNKDTKDKEKQNEPEPSKVVTQENQQSENTEQNQPPAIGKVTLGSQVSFIRTSTPACMMESGLTAFGTSLSMIRAGTPVEDQVGISNGLEQKETYTHNLNRQQEISDKLRAIAEPEPLDKIKRSLSESDAVRDDYPPIRRHPRHHFRQSLKTIKGTPYKLSAGQMTRMNARPVSQEIACGGETDHQTDHHQTHALPLIKKPMMAEQKQQNQPSAMETVTAATLTSTTTTSTQHTPSKFSQVKKRASSIFHAVASSVRNTPSKKASKRKSAETVGEFVAKRSPIEKNDEIVSSDINNVPQVLLDTGHQTKSTGTGMSPTNNVDIQHKPLHSTAYANEYAVSKQGESGALPLTRGANADAFVQQEAQEPNSPVIPVILRSKKSSQSRSSLGPQHNQDSHKNRHGLDRNSQPGSNNRGERYPKNDSESDVISYHPNRTEPELVFDKTDRSSREPKATLPNGGQFSPNRKDEDVVVNSQESEDEELDGTPRLVLKLVKSGKNAYEVSPPLPSRHPQASKHPQATTIPKAGLFPADVPSKQLQQDEEEQPEECGNKKTTQIGTDSKRGEIVSSIQAHQQVPPGCIEDGMKVLINVYSLNVNYLPVYCSHGCKVAFSAQGIELMIRDLVLQLSPENLHSIKWYFGPGMAEFYCQVSPPSSYSLLHLLAKDDTNALSVATIRLEVLSLSMVLDSLPPCARMYLVQFCHHMDIPLKLLSTPRKQQKRQNSGPPLPPPSHSSKLPECGTSIKPTTSKAAMEGNTSLVVDDSALPSVAKVKAMFDSKPSYKPAPVFKNPDSRRSVGALEALGPLDQREMVLEAKRRSSVGALGPLVQREIVLEAKRSSVEALGPTDQREMVLEPKRRSSVGALGPMDQREMVLEAKRRSSVEALGPLDQREMVVEAKRRCSEDGRSLMMEEKTEGELHGELKALASRGAAITNDMIDKIHHEKGENIEIPNAKPEMTTNGPSSTEMQHIDNKVQNEPTTDVQKKNQPSPKSNDKSEQPSTELGEDIEFKVKPTDMNPKELTKAVENELSEGDTASSQMKVVDDKTKKVIDGDTKSVIHPNATNHCSSDDSGVSSNSTGSAEPIGTTPGGHDIPKHMWSDQPNDSGTFHQHSSHDSAQYPSTELARHQAIEDSGTLNSILKDKIKLLASSLESPVYVVSPAEAKKKKERKMKELSPLKKFQMDFQALRNSKGADLIEQEEGENEEEEEEDREVADYSSLKPNSLQSSMEYQALRKGTEDSVEEEDGDDSNDAKGGRNQASKLMKGMLKSYLVTPGNVEMENVDAQIIISSTDSSNDEIDEDLEDKEPLPENLIEKQTSVRNCDTKPRAIRLLSGKKDKEREMRSNAVNYRDEDNLPSETDTASNPMSPMLDQYPYVSIVKTIQRVKFSRLLTYKTFEQSQRKNRGPKSKKLEPTVLTMYEEKVNESAMIVPIQKMLVPREYQDLEPQMTPPSSVPYPYFLVLVPDLGYALAQHYSRQKRKGSRDIAETIQIQLAATFYEKGMVMNMLASPARSTYSEESYDTNRDNSTTTTTCKTDDVIATSLQNTTAPQNLAIKISATLKRYFHTVTELENTRKLNDIGLTRQQKACLGQQIEKLEVASTDLLQSYHKASQDFREKYGFPWSEVSGSGGGFGGEGGGGDGHGGEERERSGGGGGKNVTEKVKKNVVGKVTHDTAEDREDRHDGSDRRVHAEYREDEVVYFGNYHNDTNRHVDVTGVTNGNNNDTTYGGNNKTNENHNETTNDQNPNDLTSDSSSVISNSRITATSLNSTSTQEYITHSMNDQRVPLGATMMESIKEDIVEERKDGRLGRVEREHPPVEMAEETQGREVLVQIKGRRISRVEWENPPVEIPTDEMAEETQGREGLEERKDRRIGRKERQIPRVEMSPAESIDPSHPLVEETDEMTETETETQDREITVDRKDRKIGIMKSKNPRVEIPPTGSIDILHPITEESCRDERDTETPENDPPSVSKSPHSEMPPQDVESVEERQSQRQARSQSLEALTALFTEGQKLQLQAMEVLHQSIMENYDCVQRLKRELQIERERRREILQVLQEVQQNSQSTY